MPTLETVSRYECAVAEYRDACEAVRDLEYGDFFKSLVLGRAKLSAAKRRRSTANRELTAAFRNL